MNACWCTSSGGECIGGGVSNVVSAATHDVFPGSSKLMASPAQRACGAGVANLDLIIMRPAVPDFVPSRFGVASVRGADTGIRQGGGISQCRRGWDAGCAHVCNGELNVGGGFGECGIGGDQVFDGRILLNGPVCQIVKGRSHCTWLSSAA
jgi:hypothetical protein